MRRIRQEFPEGDHDNRSGIGRHELDLTARFMRSR